MAYKVGLTEIACADLGVIVRFVAQSGASSEAALRMGHALLDAALSLSIFPRRGAPVRRRPGLRKLAHHHWLIFYQVDEATQSVEIVRIWDGRQSPTELRFPRTTRESFEP